MAGGGVEAGEEGTGAQGCSRRGPEARGALFFRELRQSWPLMASRPSVSVVQALPQADTGAVLKSGGANASSAFQSDEGG